MLKLFVNCISIWRLSQAIGLHLQSLSCSKSPLAFEHGDYSKDRWTLFGLWFNIWGNFLFHLLLLHSLPSCQAPPGPQEVSASWPKAPATGPSWPPRDSNLLQLTPLEAPTDCCQPIGGPASPLKVLANSSPANIQKTPAGQLGHQRSHPASNNLQQ